MLLGIAPPMPGTQLKAMLDMVPYHRGPYVHLFPQDPSARGVYDNPFARMRIYQALDKHEVWIIWADLPVKEQEQVKGQGESDSKGAPQTPPEHTAEADNMSGATADDERESPVHTTHSADGSRAGARANQPAPTPRGAQSGKGKAKSRREEAHQANETQRAPHVMSLAEAMLSGMRLGRPVQIVLVIGMGVR